MSNKSVRQVILETYAENHNKQRITAVFAPEDYSVIRKALQVYLHNYGTTLEEDEARIVARVLHRLGRIEYE